MRFLLKFFGLLFFSFALHAEPPGSPPPPPKSGPNVQVYTKESAANVEALNNATEVLRDPTKALPLPEIGKAVDKVTHTVADKKELPRDPTQMSGNFRQALKNMGPAPAAAAGTTGNTAAVASAEKAIPMVELVAKIMGKNKSVLLRLKDRTGQVFEGGQISLVEDGKISVINNQSVISFRVDKIDENEVRITVLPYNAKLILR